MSLNLQKAVVHVDVSVVEPAATAENGLNPTNGNTV